MSELIDIRDNRATIRWKLMTTASALALTAYVSSTSIARAEDTDRPQIWIELGGQMEMMDGLSSPFVAPFMLKTPTPLPYLDRSPIENQKPPRFAFGAEGKISFQPEDSDWIFTAGLRYGRSHSNRHVHVQTQVPPFQFTFGTAYHYTFTKYPAPFADTKAPFNEKHTIVDFSAGRDVGIGVLGSAGTSTLNAGIRFAQFSSRTGVDVEARPTLHPKYLSFFPPGFPAGFTWYQYHMSGHATRSFKGIGPSLSWNASAALLGDPQHGEITMDWGINVAALFGRQKAKTDHATQTKHKTYSAYPLIHHTSVDNPLRSRSIMVPNVGGFAGLSFRYVDAKISLGYRADAFFNAMDTGIDATKKSNLTFNGPYASISIGMGD